MPKYVSLVNWTDQGIRDAKSSVDRAEAAQAAAAAMGGSFDIYYTVGAYDIVTVAEFPDDETATAFLIQLGSLGNVRSSTMRAFDLSEMRGILAKLG